MKRALAILAMLASVAATSGPAFAVSSVNQYGSVKLAWNVAVAMTATVHTNYTGAFANNGATATVNPSTAAATFCGTTPATQTDLNITWGPITPSATAGTYVGCDYESALGVSVTTNDSSGFQVWQYLDSAPPAGIVFCAYPNTAAGTFPMAPASSILTSEYASTAPTAYTGSACGTHGTPLTQGTGGTLTNSGVAPAQPAAAGTYSGEYYANTTPGGTGFEMMGQASAAATAVMDGEDLQINVGSTAASTNGTASTDYITLQFVAN